MSSRIDLVIVDDHTIFRSGFAKLLSEFEPFNVIAQAGSVGETLQLVAQGISPDLFTLDINLAGENALEMIPKLRQQLPNIPILVLSMYPAEQFADAAYRAGANGYLSKDASPPELFQAITRLAQGDSLRPTDNEPDRNSEDLSRAMRGYPHERLSERELEIMRLIADGDSLTEIGEKMFLSVKTVSTYRTRILEKMSMSNNAELIKYAVAHGLTLSNY